MIFDRYSAQKTGGEGERVHQRSSIHKIYVTVVYVSRLAVKSPEMRKVQPLFCLFHFVLSQSGTQKSALFWRYTELWG